MDTDRQLLFAVLALRANLLDADRFAEACQRWAAREEQPLAELLVERGWLNDADKVHVDYLLERNVQQHGDARSALKAVADAPEWRAVASVDDPELRAWLAEALPGAEWLREQDAEERKRRWGPVVTILAGALLLLLVLGGLAMLGGVFVFRQRAQVEQRLMAMEARAQADMARAVELEARRVPEMQALEADSLGQLEKSRGRLKEAEQLFRQAMEILERLLKESPTEKRLRQHMAAVCEHLGELLKETNRAKEAEQFLERAKALREKLQAEAPAKPKK